MANKKLGTAASELRLPTKKVKGEKKLKWQAKTGGRKAKNAEFETPEVVVEEAPTLPTEPTDAAVVATTSEAGPVEPSTPAEVATTTDATVPTKPEPEPTSPAGESVPAKPKMLKVQAGLQPKKLSMVAAALQVLQDRKLPMTCPELIDAMATEGLWVSPGGKTPANTLYAAISRIIKEKGEESPFRKAERGKFEARILTNE